MNNKQEWEELKWTHHKLTDNFGMTLEQSKQVNDLITLAHNNAIEECQSLLSQREAEIRKETIEAVLPCKVKTTIGKESKYFKEYGFDRNNFVTGHNQCRQSIIDFAKEKFNITI